MGVAFVTYLRRCITDLVGGEGVAGHAGSLSWFHERERERERERVEGKSVESSKKYMYYYMKLRAAVDRLCMSSLF